MVTQRIIVGIDPDVTANGVAELDAYSRHCEAYTADTYKLIKRLQELSETTSGTTKLTIVVEAGWLNGGCWHVLPSDSRRLASAKGYQVGRNHQVGIIICEVARGLGLSVVEQKPLRKVWRGRDKKITSWELEQLTGLQGRTTQDTRDAVLLAWSYAGLPMRLRQIRK